MQFYTAEREVLLPFLLECCIKVVTTTDNRVMFIESLGNEHLLHLIRKILDSELGVKCSVQNNTLTVLDTLLVIH